jgi:hypothetical protein
MRSLMAVNNGLVQVLPVGSTASKNKNERLV